MRNSGNFGDSDLGTYANIGFLRVRAKLCLTVPSDLYSFGSLTTELTVIYPRSDLTLELTSCLVALSRAKEGLFILGNSRDLSSRSRMWNTIIDELEDTECIGPAFPVSCQRHPERINYISEPGKLKLIAPDGKK